MRFELWYVFIGGLFVLVTMVGTLTQRLPVTLTMLYLAAGLVLGPLGFGVAAIAVIEQAALLERLSELAVIISLFTAGLKLRCPLLDVRWAVPLRLAFGDAIGYVVARTIAGRRHAPGCSASTDGSSAGF